ncbi:unnamed protein product [Ilex paraguariensis]|uniref:Uncharacterized protein n=1 Tax=Ilex paraguariensis TaxID=185542 RepID=A0ABC8SVZ2_9AQUA
MIHHLYKGADDDGESQKAVWTIDVWGLTLKGSFLAICRSHVSPIVNPYKRPKFSVMRLMTFKNAKLHLPVASIFSHQWPDPGLISAAAKSTQKIEPKDYVK